MRLRDALDRLADEGVPRGAARVFKQAEDESPRPTRPAQRPVLRFVIVAATLGVVAIGLMAMSTRRSTLSSAPQAVSSAASIDRPAPTEGSSAPASPAVVLTPSASSTDATDLSSTVASTTTTTAVSPFAGDEIVGCKELAQLSRPAVPSEYVLQVGRPIGYPSLGCELFFQDPSGESLAVARRDGPHDAPVVVDGEQRFGRTGDTDEQTQGWDAGTIAYADPTGPDIAGLSTAAQVTVWRTDGTLVTVTSYREPGPGDIDLAVSVGHRLDQAVAATAPR